MRGCLFQGPRHRPGASSSILAQTAQPIWRFEGSETMKSIIPAELSPDQVTAIQESREQLPLDLHPLRVEVAGLDTGDYSLKGLEHLVAVERKGLSDLLACIGTGRHRFERELQRLLAYPVRCRSSKPPGAEDRSGKSGGARSPPRRPSVRYSAGSLWAFPIIMSGTMNGRADMFPGRYSQRREGVAGTATPAAAVGTTADSQVPEPVGFAVGTARRSTARPAAVGIVRLGCRSTTGQLSPAARGIGQGPGNRAKRTSTSHQGRRDSAPFFLGQTQGKVQGMHTWAARGARPKRTSTCTRADPGPAPRILCLRFPRPVFRTFAPSVTAVSDPDFQSNTLDAIVGIVFIQEKVRCCTAPDTRKPANLSSRSKKSPSLRLQRAFSYSPFVVPVSNPLGSASSEALVILSISLRFSIGIEIANRRMRCKRLALFQGQQIAPAQSWWFSPIRGTGQTRPVGDSWQRQCLACFFQNFKDTAPA